MRDSHIPTLASAKTRRRLVSLTHLILKPPRTASHSLKAAWMSLVFSSGGKPVRDNIRVTEADKGGRLEDMWRLIKVEEESAVAGSGAVVRGSFERRGVCRSST